MTHMTKNNLPPVEEQKFIQEEQLTLQRMLSQFEQPIPNDFIQIKTEHVCSTKPTWEGKPLSERYSLTHEGKWRWIDIPHELMEKMGLQKGEDIKQNLYLDPDVLTHPKTYKGITIQEGEIFLQQSFTIQNLEQNLDKLTKKINVLENKNRQNQEMLSNFKQLVPDEFEELDQPKKYWGSTEGWKEPICERYSFKYGNGKSAMLDITKELNDKLKLNPKDNFCVKKETLSRSPEEGGITINDEKEIFLKKSFTVENLKEDIDKLIGKIGELEGELKKWKNQFQDQTPQQVQEKINNLQQELDKERGWWDKWIEDERTSIDFVGDEMTTLVARQIAPYSFSNSLGIKFRGGSPHYLKYSVLQRDGSVKIGKKVIKVISEYYK